jgi:Family of unknown function (DUF6152)
MALARILPVILCAVTFWGSACLAHHSYAAYDATETRTLRGTVKTFDWSNPHSAIDLLLEPQQGDAAIEWHIETSSPAILKRFGWTHDSVKAGDRVSLLCNPINDGSHKCRLHTVVLLATGQVLLTKLSAGDPAQSP